MRAPVSRQGLAARSAPEAHCSLGSAAARWRLPRPPAGGHDPKTRNVSADCAELHQPKAPNRWQPRIVASTLELPPSDALEEPIDRSSPARPKPLAASYSRFNARIASVGRSRGTHRPFESCPPHSSDASKVRSVQPARSSSTGRPARSGSSLSRPSIVRNPSSNLQSAPRERRAMRVTSRRFAQRCGGRLPFSNAPSLQREARACLSYRAALPHARRPSVQVRLKQHRSCALARAPCAQNGASWQPVGRSTAIPRGPLTQTHRAPDHGTGSCFRLRTDRWWGRVRPATPSSRCAKDAFCSTSRAAAQS
jgi:hypothetical protein